MHWPEYFEEQFELTHSQIRVLTVACIDHALSELYDVLNGELQAEFLNDAIRIVDCQWKLARDAKVSKAITEELYRQLTFMVGLHMGHGEPNKKWKFLFRALELNFQFLLEKRRETDLATVIISDALEAVTGHLFDRAISTKQFEYPKVKGPEAGIIRSRAAHEFSMNCKEIQGEVSFQQECAAKLARGGRITRSRPKEWYVRES